MDLERFLRLPLMGILRGGSVTDLEPLLEAASDAGLETLEITLNTTDGLAMIRRAREIAGERLMIGAGTVLSAEQVSAATAAGASFVVSPVLIGEVMEACRNRAIPVFPGALTPLEIFTAANAGAAMVKVFPASAFGPGYLRELRGPFGDVALLACGGVRPENCADYFAAGARAVAFGASVFSVARFAARDYEAMRRDVAALVAATRSASGTRAQPAQATVNR